MKLSSVFAISVLTTPHRWFAWIPVMAEQKVGDAVHVQAVWLESVVRTLIRVQGVSVYRYEVIPK